jgi:ABC-type multidrug transport system permease subunit
MKIQENLKNIPVVCLIAANMIPLCGVAFFGWDTFSIVLLYWAENLIIGFYSILKIAISKAEILAKLFAIPFFILHYGGFCAAHGIFVFALFGKGMLKLSSEGSHHFSVPFEPSFNTARQIFADIPQAFLWTFLALFVSHGISFVHNFIIKGEYLHTNSDQLMASPYSRIVVMHIAIIGGAFLSKAVGSSVAVLIVLVILKTIVDLKLHLRERKKFGAPALNQQ